MSKYNRLILLVLRNIIMSNLILLFACICSSCHGVEAREIIAVADSLDQNEHVIYDDTVALKRVICSLDNPFGRLLHSNTLGKAYYYMGRNYSLSNQIEEAAECYIEADRLQIDDPIYRGRVNSCMGYICAQNNSDSLALIFYERASEDFLESKDEWYYAQTLLDRAEFQTNLHNYVAADSLLNNALLYNLDSAYIARYYETKGLYYYELQQHDSALVYFKKSINLHQMDPSYTYLKILQTYHRVQLLDSAIPYAKWIISHSNNPNYRLNAYFIVIKKATQENQTNLLAEYSEARQDTHRILESLNESYSLATEKLLSYINNPHPWRWGWILLALMIVMCVGLVIGDMIIYKRNTNKQHISREQMSNISASLAKREKELIEANQKIHRAKLIDEIRIKYPTPPNKWNDYRILKKDISPYLSTWLSALEELNLTNRENVLCTFIFLYPYLSVEELAKFMCVTKGGVQVIRTHVVKKIGVESNNLVDYLQKLSNN